MNQESVSPGSIAEVIDFIKTNTLVIPRGGGSKPALWQSTDAQVIDLGKLTGVVEYQPSEYTITVQAGTSLREVIDTLKANGQYLPFDPPMASQGATIGGTVAAGLSGPGAYRYGPLKDFIIGVRFIDGRGNHVKGGGKVVKNAAGFDFPKLFNGSLGRLGILTEVSFKVFPEPRRYVTLHAAFDCWEDAIAVLPKLKGFDVEGAEIDSEHTLFLRLAYQEPTMATRKLGLEALAGKTLDMTFGEEEAEVWQRFKLLDSPSALYKIATHPQSALSFLNTLKDGQWSAHLTNGAKTLLLKGPENTDRLESMLKAHGLTGLQLKGAVNGNTLKGRTSSLPFVDRIKKALDPDDRFPPFQTTEAHPVR